MLEEVDAFAATSVVNGSGEPPSNAAITEGDKRTAVQLSRDAADSDTLGSRRRNPNTHAPPTRLAVTFTAAKPHALLYSIAAETSSVMATSMTPIDSANGYTSAMACPAAQAAGADALRSTRAPSAG